MTSDKLNIDKTYKSATNQELRPQDRRLVSLFAAQVLSDYAELIRVTANYSDVDNPNFEDGKMAVVGAMLSEAEEIKGGLK